MESTAWNNAIARQAVAPFHAVEPISWNAAGLQLRAPVPRGETNRAWRIPVGQRRPRTGIFEQRRELRYPFAGQQGKGEP